MSFISLSERIKDKDPQGFLLSYLQLVVAGKQLILPTSDSYENVKSAWESILYGVPGGYSSSFLIQLSNMWVQIVKAVPSSSQPDFPRRVLTYLQTNHLSDLIQATPDIVTTVKPKGKVLQKGRPIIDHLDDDQVEKKIQQPVTHHAVVPTLPSSDGEAYQHIHTDSLDFSQVPANEQKMHESLRSEEVDAFLVHYLTKTLYQISPRVPMSSVLDIIYYQWRDILMGEFNQLPSERFLKLLSKRWFGLMTQNGLPNSRDKIKALIYIVMKGSGASSREGTGGPMKKKLSFWQLFRKALMSCFVLSLIVLTSCREKVSIYEVPKEVLITDQSVMASFQAVSQSPVNRLFKWVVPQGWEEIPSESGFDRGRYRVHYRGQEVVVAITSMTGNAPDMMSNLNRWRGQLKLSPATNSDLAASVKPAMLGDFQVQWVSVSNGTDGFEIAVLRHEEENWFFKISGPLSVVKNIVPQLKTLISKMKIALPKDSQ